MKINRIKINNFKSIYDPLDINFNNMKGFWKISGSVGSGKTTIGESIIYGLFGTVGGKNNSDLISWGQKHGCIELWCESKGNNIYIKREINAYGQSPVYVEVNGEEMIFTNKRDAQLKLETEYFDTSKMIVELLCIISFNNFKSLSTLNTSDTRKFLDQVLGFSILTEYSDICKDLRSEITNSIRNLENDIKQKQLYIDKLNSFKNKPIIEGNIDDVIKIIEENTKELDNLKYDYTIYLQEKNDELVQLKKQQASIITLGKNKAKEIKFIENGTCPTCGAPIDNSQLNIKIQEKEILTNQYKDITSKIADIEKELESMKLDFDNKVKPLRDIIKENKILKYKLDGQSKQISFSDEHINNTLIEIDDIKKLIHVQSIEELQWDELYNILSKDVRENILNSFIPILNENIQKYVQILQLPYIIYFDNSFKCHIELFGLNNDISISSLSTGQLKIVDMVIILGILGTILGSSGINIIFLDELFSNFDNELRETICKILKDTLADDKIIFIISHQDINNQIFNGEIELELENHGAFQKRSKIKINQHGIK